ncbi:protein secretion protein [Virgibacillus sp. MSP4-1]|uniref:peptidylprolyl isomerase n=1 Tax=Virgibacillus sp. MSP4-1 TaxID=2700081 RepID=UPI0003A4196F|nr:peptidyl-prolyl cis-trans isomerase [Virgibacillus sp. MSP4-1]QHS23905.1 protein secretion protein [Virgibacillus sp. MSP4-1]
MSKRLLWGMITVLMVTNITTVLLFTNGNQASIDEFEDGRKIPNEVAVVGDESIKAEEWLDGLEQNYGKSYLKSAINQKVVFRLAEKQNLSLNDKLIQKELATIETASGIMSDKERERKREQWKKNIRYQNLLEELLTQDIQVTDSEVAQVYEEEPDQFDFPTSYQLSQIIVEDESTAQKVIRELEGGSSFSSLAKEYSIDENTSEKGGVLGYFPEDSTYLQDIYFETVENMEEDSYSQPFEIEDGTVILYLHQVLPGIDLQLEDARNEIRREIAKNKMTQEISAEYLWGEVGVNWIYGDQS